MEKSFFGRVLGLVIWLLLLVPAISQVQGEFSLLGRFSSRARLCVMFYLLFVCSCIALLLILK